MKKQILNLGAILTKVQQKSINGGALLCGPEYGDCPPSGPHGNYFCCLEQEICRYDFYPNQHNC